MKAIFLKKTEHGERAIEFKANQLWCDDHPTTVIHHTCKHNKTYWSLSSKTNTSPRVLLNTSCYTNQVHKPLKCLKCQKDL